MRVVSEDTWNKLEEIEQIARQHYADACVGIGMQSYSYTKGEYEMADYLMNILREESTEGKAVRDIYKETIEKWGVLSQIGMANEEMGELMTAMNQFFRGRVDKDKVAEEIADVLLMMQEMAYVFGRDRVMKWYKIKKQTVIERLDK